MNVLLAEADIPYDKLKEMDEINPSFGQTDVVIVIGANDVVNPLANTDPQSPIAGMPILNVGEARTVVVVKRSLSPGFAGIPNPLFAADNTLMLFEDGKKAVVDIVAAMKAVGLSRPQFGCSRLQSALAHLAVRLLLFALPVESVRRAFIRISR